MPSRPSRSIPTTFRRQPKAHLERARQSMRRCRTFGHRPDHHEAPRPHLTGSSKDQQEGRQRLSAQNHRKTAARPEPLRAKPYGSFLPPVAFVRSRGSPNFLQLGDSKTHACIDRCRWGCMHRSGQRVRRNGRQRSTPCDHRSRPGTGVRRALPEKRAGRWFLLEPIPSGPRARASALSARRRRTWSRYGSASSPHPYFSSAGSSKDSIALRFR
jgi:hypothetical protein